MAAELLNKGSMPLYMLVPSIAQDKLACMAQPSCAYIKYLMSYASCKLPSAMLILLNQACLVY